MVLPSSHSHCESSPGSFDECRLGAGWPIWAESADRLLSSADTIATIVYDIHKDREGFNQIVDACV